MERLRTKAQEYINELAKMTQDSQNRQNQSYADVNSNSDLEARVNK